MQGEKECMYFMRTGTCKYAATCRFNHPDPTSTDGGDRDKLKPPVEYSNSSSRLESPPPPSPPQFPASAIPWSSPAEAMMYSSSPTQSPKPEWNNGYQVCIIMYLSIIDAVQVYVGLISTLNLYCVLLSFL